MVAKCDRKALRREADRVAKLLEDEDLPAPLPKMLAFCSDECRELYPRDFKSGALLRAGQGAMSGWEHDA